MFKSELATKVTVVQWVFEREYGRILMYPLVPLTLGKDEGYIVDFYFGATKENRKDFIEFLKQTGIYHENHNFESTMKTLYKLRLKFHIKFWQEICCIEEDGYFKCNAENINWEEFRIRK